MAHRLEIEIPHDAPLHDDALKKQAARTLRLKPEDLKSVDVVKRALDARKRRPKPTWRLTLDVDTSKKPNAPAGANLREIPKKKPWLQSPRAPQDAPPVVVVGAGPAGLFAAWHLAEHGAKVHLIERGKPVETRARDFGRFRGRGQLDTESNICFGEGGAGTYSDGKLTCRKGGPLAREVLERFVAAGAPERILTDAKPHVGTNKLFALLKGIRKRLLDDGVEIHFETRVESLKQDDGRLAGVETSAGAIDAPRVVLAIGHSARDTYKQLLAQGVPMEAKPFAVGVRAEHPQQLIDSAQYKLRAPRDGEPTRPETLPPADYRLAQTVGDDRGVYSFCMCPGGMVIPSSTEHNMLVVNGMSSARRSTPFANSGVVVQIREEDLDIERHGPLAGVELQRELERKAFEVGGGGYVAPASRVSDFVAGRASTTLADSHFRPGLSAANLNDVFPKFIVEGLRQALPRFNQDLQGYTTSEANLIAVESRTSSPLKIPRDHKTMEVIGFSGLFVAGEGPGYAGGIVSAAMDGIKVAQAVLQSMSQ